MIPVLWYLNDSNWDTALPKYILSHATQCEHFLGLENAPMLRSRIAVIVIPGRHAAGEEHYLALTRAGKCFRKVVYVVIGDEEGIFHSAQIRMPNSVIWWLMPPFHPKQDVDQVGPNGWPGDALRMIARAKDVAKGERPYDWSFQGQMTHSRRIACVSATQELDNGIVLPTNGFTQGVPQEEYYATMVRSKFVLCPSGPCTPDSFRFAEALEAGCVPIVDNLIQHVDYPPGYWKYVFGTDTFPFPVIEDWSKLPEIMEQSLKLWKVLAEGCAAWWVLQKQMWILKMKEDLS